MKVMEKLPETPRWRYKRHGVQVYRKILDFTGIEAAQQALIQNFGSDVAPLPEDHYLFSRFNIIGRNESARAVMAARISGSMATASQLKQELTARMPLNARGSLVSESNSFDISKNATLNAARGLILLSMVHDDRHMAQRGQLTDIIDLVTGVPYSWNDFDSSIPIAKIRNTDVAESIRGFHVDQMAEIAFSPIVVAYKYKR